MNENKFVYVAGSINMDVVASGSEIPKPGMTVMGKELNYFPGGKGANQAVAAKRASAPTKMLGCLGSDTFGDALLDVLRKEDINTDEVQKVKGASGVALIVVQDDGENAIIVTPGANNNLSEDVLNNANFDDCAIGVSQFEIPIPTIECFFKRCKEVGATTILNTAPALEEIGSTFELSDILIFNETELSKYSGCELDEKSKIDEVVNAARLVRRKLNQKIIVTLGKRGLVAIDGDRALEVPGIPVSSVDTTGAGDCFVGYFSSQILKGLTLEDALIVANKAASISVQRNGAAPSIPFLNEL